ncbi:alcohol dehydrogenase catalytic domain-containing protein [uncultured Friedmanniella sp.]|uniref:alcohol dehydrogenase catalytic domain-containing protein n=1 Tax=uncultured Friedmanniella sp. TaxID=335381 RepID=UPI0035CA1ACB
MKAVFIREDGSIDVSTTPDPAPGRDEVVIAVGAAGICGTDLHIIDREIEFATLPVVPGHELSGTVVALGPDVDARSVALGDRVAVSPGITCGVCRYCRRGRSNLCPHASGIGISRNGGAAEFAAVPAANCYALPAEMPMHAGALVEPLSCAIHGMDLLPRGIDEEYLIYGAGTMGLLMMQLALASSARSVSVIDTNPGRLESARMLGAHHVANSADDLSREYGWSTVIDCTGAVAAIEDGLSRVDRGGTFQAFGVARGDALARISPFRLYHDEITIVGSMAVLNSFGRAVDVMASGAVDADVIVSHQLGLDDYPTAINLFRNKEGRKIMVTPPSTWAG